MVVLGIDPGLAQTGWGVIETINNRHRLIAYGIVKTKTDKPLEKRIFAIAFEIGLIATKYNIEQVSMEDIFFAKNVSSAINVAKVIGAIIQQLSVQNLEVKLFTPLQIKSSVTGYGTADKHQVQQMVKLLLKLDGIVKPDHASDSLAAAICFANNRSFTNKVGRIL